MSSPAQKRTGHARTIGIAALLLAALLVVVALASRARLEAGESAGGHDRPSLPAGAFAYVYAGLLVLGLLALPLFFYIYTRDTPYSPSGRRRARLAPLLLVGYLGIGLAVTIRWSDDIRTALARLGVLARDGDRTPDAAAAAVRPPAPGWLPFLAAWGAVALAVGAVVAWRLLRRRRRGASLAAALSDALDDTLDDVADEPDPRRAIILAYARMEAALDGSGCSRRHAEAPLEYLARVLGELDVAPAPIERLTDLFERAKFSHHPIDATMKADAIEALQAVRAELREAA